MLTRAGYQSSQQGAFAKALGVKSGLHHDRVLST